MPPAMDRRGLIRLLCFPFLWTHWSTSSYHPRAAMHRILYIAFALSGAAGLIYEAVWGRYLALFVGHAAFAQVLVIGTYLGGMALGAFLVGAKSRKIRSPLLWYAFAEGGLALLGVCFHTAFQAGTGLAYDWLIPTLGNPLLAGIAKWMLAVLLLLPQAVLLGTTFPLMSAGVLRGFPGRPGRTLSLLYFTNSLGAAVGVLVGGFVLVATLGLPGSLVVAAILNLLAATAALAVFRAAGSGSGAGVQEDSGSSSGRTAAEEDSGPPPGRTAGAEDSADETTVKGHGRNRGLVPLLLGVSFLTAVASFAYEIGWIRMLSLVMGSATHSFEVMLSAFILGLALGAYFVRSRADSGGASLELLGWVQWAMGLAALATLPIYVSTFETMAFLVDVLPHTDGGYTLFGVARYGIAMAVMLPSTILAGMTLPLITALLMRTGQGERAIGRVYGFNTLGSVLGVGAAGLVAMPILGLKGVILAGAALDMALGIVILFWRRRGSSLLGAARAPLLATAVSLTGLLMIQSGLKMDQRLLLSGVFRYGAIPDTSEPVLFYKDGRTATVGVHVERAQDLAVLTTNGKPDASISLRWIRAQAELLPPRPIVFDDEGTQTLLALMPLAHLPTARTVAHIGHGSGLTAHASLASPAIQRAVTIEIEPEMIAASEAFYPANARAFDDPRSTFVIDDAKAYFANRRETFDLIISEPSNPWVSGTSSLFTLEFYQRIRRYMAPGGLFAQWFHCYEMTDALVSSVLAAIQQAFPHYRGYQVGPGDLLIVASKDSPLPPPDWSVFQLPAVRRMLAHVPPFTPRHLQALHLFEGETLGPYLADWKPVNSDFYPVLDEGAERARFQKKRAEGFLSLGSRRIILSAFLDRIPRGFTDDCSEPALGVGPLQRLALGCWLRKARHQSVLPEDAPGEAQRRALEDYRAFRAAVSGETAPDDWPGFTHLAARVEGDLHAGTAGVADSLFYRTLFDFLQNVQPPPEVLAAADFLFGTASWDAGRAAGAAKILLDARGAGGEWIPDDLLREGAVLAFLAEGDPLRAAAALALLQEEEADPLSVRVEILRGLVRQELGGATGSGSPDASPGEGP